MRLRIVSYNIMSGGEGRADPLAEVLIAQRADVIIVLEAGDVEVLQRLAKRLDMNWWQVENSNQTCAFLSRIPMENSAELSQGSKMDVFVADWSINEKRVAIAVGSGAPPENVVAWAGESDTSSHWIEPKLRRQARSDEASSNVQPERTASKLLVREGVRIIDAWIECDRLAVYASDHLPVGVEIEL